MPISTRLEASQADAAVAECAYLTGFGNHHAIQAVPGALPIRQNSPQHVPYGLFADQLSGTAFTAPRAENRRSWLYRLRPTAHFVPYDKPSLLRSGPFDEVPPSPNRLRWDPLPLPTGPADFVDGLVTYAGNGNAILEWLEERYPDPPLLPQDRDGRAVVLAMAAILGCDIHPLGNLRVLQALHTDLGSDETQVSTWIVQWTTSGFVALEMLILRNGAGYAYGDVPKLADAYIVPQVYAAWRFGVPLEALPAIVTATDKARLHPAIAAAAPEAQPDADKP